MDNRKKNAIYSAILLVSILAVWQYRKSNAQVLTKVEGKTMGTTYHVSYFDEEKRNFKVAIDSLLLIVNKSINTYDATSEATAFNKSKKGIAYQLPHLKDCLQKAYEVFSSSKGAFDPTVMPLVNAWGFGHEERRQLTREQIDSVLNFVGFQKIKLTPDGVLKLNQDVQLDFGGIGQGYGADVITDFLKAQGITDMLVEVGGEGMALGQNLVTKKPWEIGILDPNSTYEDQFFKAYISLTNRSFTTSGNYFNYYELDGVKYSHTIDPFTGYPAKQSILSASVFSDDCTSADAWGTAFMVMGHEKAIKFLEAQSSIDALLIYNDEKGKMQTFATAGIKPFLKIEQESAK